MFAFVWVSICFELNGEIQNNLDKTTSMRNREKVIGTQGDLWPSWISISANFARAHTRVFILFLQYVTYLDRSRDDDEEEASITGADKNVEVVRGKVRIVNSVGLRSGGAKTRGERMQIG